MTSVWFADGFDAAVVGQVVHAVRNTISGPRAWCGAGVVTEFSGRFKVDADRSCPLCSDLVRGLLPQPRPAAD